MNLRELITEHQTGDPDLTARWSDDGPRPWRYGLQLAVFISAIMWVGIILAVKAVL